MFRASSAPPGSILLVRPDTYGDLLLFEPALRALRRTWPETRVAVLVRAAYADLAPLLPDGIEWLTTECEPYRRQPDAPEEARHVASLQAAVRAFDPAWLVAAAFQPTWLSYLAAAAAPRAQRLRLGRDALDPLTTAALTKVIGPFSETDLWPAALDVEAGSAETEKNRLLAEHLCGPAPGPWPLPEIRIPPAARAEAEQILAAAGLTPGAFLACAPVGTSNVPIKAWPARGFAEVVARGAREHGLGALLIGSAAEAGQLAAVQSEARAAGAANVACHAARPGSIATSAALLALSRVVLGNDSGLLHFAAALGRPAVGIYGGGTWPRFLPAFRGPGVVLVQPLPCFGCGWDCSFGNAPCLQALPAGPVGAALADVLDGRVAAGRPDIRELTELPQETRDWLGVAHGQLRAVRRDSADRLSQIESLRRSATERAEEFAARGSQIEELTALLRGSEEDRAALHRQVPELNATVEAREAEFQSRGRQIETLSEALREAEAAKARLNGQVEALNLLQRNRETEFQSRGEQIDRLGGLLREAEEDRAARGEQIERLRVLVQESEDDRAARGEQIDRLRDLLAESEEDRAARGEQIDRFRALLQESETDRTARAEQIERLTAMVRGVEADRVEQTDRLTALLRTAEEDRAARGEILARLGPQLEESERARRQAGAQLVTSRECLRAAEADRAHWREEARRVHFELALARRLLAAQLGSPPPTVPGLVRPAAGPAPRSPMANVLRWLTRLFSPAPAKRP